MIQIQLKKQFPFIEIWKSLGNPVKGETCSPSFEARMLRLHTYLEKQNISMDEFANKLGVDGIHSIYTNFDWANARLETYYPELNKEWLLEGKGEMFN